MTNLQHILLCNYKFNVHKEWLLFKEFNYIEGVQRSRNEPSPANHEIMCIYFLYIICFHTLTKLPFTSSLPFNQ